MSHPIATVPLAFERLDEATMRARAAAFLAMLSHAVPWDRCAGTCGGHPGLSWAAGSGTMAGLMTLERDLGGTVLAGRYRVLSQLGGGGMGTVHAGEHIEVGRKVAIKVLRPDAVSQPALVERFRREARLTARVEHEHVVECLDVGVSDDGLCFYVMEWLRGEDLQALLRRERSLPWPRVRAIVGQICRALATRPASRGRSALAWSRRPAARRCGRPRSTSGGGRTSSRPECSP